MLRNPAEETWYVHAPLKKVDNRPMTNAPPPSQIPYLNGVLDTDEDLKQKDLWFKETDSEFVRLSKLGGRDDLLIHRNGVGSREPVGYPRAEWWTDMLTEYVDTNKEDVKEEPYVFEVPAWFAHNDKVKQSEHENIYQKNFSSYVPSFHKYEPIEEPLKYGQLRNYLKPATIKLPKSKTNVAGNVVNKNFVRKLEENMHKLLSNYYQGEKPKNFKEWQDKQGKK